MTALTRSLAAGLAPDGIRVNAIAPSFVSTRAAEGLARGRRLARDDRATAPAGDPDAEEIAPLVVYLASDESRRMTGTVIPLDSGYMAFKARLDVMGAMQANG